MSLNPFEDMTLEQAKMLDSSKGRRGETLGCLVSERALVDFSELAMIVKCKVAEVLDQML